MDFPKDQRGRGAAASRKGRINVEHGALAAPQYQKIMAQGTDYFKLTIQNYLDARAREDELFAPRYANPKKNIDDCCTFIINQVRQSGCNGFADEEIYSMALHYYDEEDIDIGKRQLQGSGQSHRRTDRGGKSEHGGTPYGRPRAKPTPSWRKPSPNPRKSKITN